MSAFLARLERLGDVRIAALLTLLGVLVRAGHLATPYMDSDQAVFGLQALHVFKGEFPAFSWGYAYIGTLQTYVDAFFFAVFGANRVVLNAVALLFYAGYSISLYHLSGAFFAARRWRALVTALGAVAPGYFVHHGVWARHGYPETFFFGTLILALVCNHLGPEERPRFHAGLFFVAGLAWWSNFLILYYFVPLGLYLLYQLALGSSWRARAGVVAASALGFLAGSLPFWVHNLRNGFDSLTIFRKAPPRQEDLEAVAKSSWNTFTVLVGAREQGADYTVAYLGPALAVLSAAALLFFALRRASLLPRILARRRLVPGDVLLVFFAALLLVFFGSRQSARGIRFLIPFYSLYPVYLACALKALAGRRWLVAALLVFLFGMNTASALEWNPLVDAPFRERYHAGAAADQRLFAELVRADRRQVLTYNYWDAYRLTFDARERVIVDHVNSRHPEYLYDMFAAPVVSYLTRGASPQFEAGARLLGFSFSARQLESWVLYTDFLPAVPRAVTTVPTSRYRLTGADGQEAFGVLGDRLLTTAAPLADGAGADEVFVDVQFSEPTQVAGLALLPDPPGSAPTNIRVTDPDSGSVLAAGDNVYYGYLLGGHPYIPGGTPLLEVFFPPRRTRRLRVSFSGPVRRAGFAVKELLVFEPQRDGTTVSDAELFGRVGRERGFDGVYCGMAAVRPLEKALGRSVEHALDRVVSFEKRNLFVFEKEYLRHNLEVLGTLGIACDSAAGDTFAFIVTRTTGTDEGRWLEKALFVHRDPAKTGADFLRGTRLAGTDDAGAEALLLQALARDPGHFGSLWALERISERRGDAARLGEYRVRREKLFPGGWPVEAAFGSTVELKALALSAGQLHPGERFTISLALTPLKKIRADYGFFLHVLSPEGQVLFQVDRRFGPKSATELHPGELVKLDCPLTVPPDLAVRGALGVYFGITKPGGRRLRAGTALEVRGNRVRIAEITVRSP